jgi:hypothetical protein
MILKEIQNAGFKKLLMKLTTADDGEMADLPTGKISYNLQLPPATR